MIARPRLGDLAELVRAPAALSVPGDVIAGAAAAGTLRPRTALTAAASVCLYWAGMAANDWADRRLDAEERPERPIPSGRVAPSAAVGVAIGLTATGLGLAALCGGRAWATAIPLAATIWGYDLVWKDTAAGPAAMAACRGLDVLIGAAASGGRNRDAAVPALLMAGHTYAVTELSRHEVHGGQPETVVRTLAATAVVAGVAAGRTGRAAAALAGIYVLSAGRDQIPIAAEPTARRFRAAVGAGITAMPALQGALAARAGRPVTGALVAAGVPLGRRVARKLSPT
jgi:4-hydroxybenzoate polyprenyltransferase